MANGVNRLAQAKAAYSKKRGKAFVEELNKQMSPEALSKIKPETEPKK